MAEYTLSNGVIVSSSKKVRDGFISVEGEKLSANKKGTVVELNGASVVYPALINTHDHMRGNYLPRVGPKPGNFYLNWLPWDNDLKASDTYMERSNLSIEDMYTFSSYKNLFSGVTTVNDHFPHAWNKDILPKLPIRAITNYGLAHEASSYDLKWGDGIEIEHKRAVKNKWPFITHLAEGFDEEAMNGVKKLEKMGILDKHCLFIHCLAFSDEDIQKTAKAGASVSWCAASNMFMFNTTCKIRKLLEAGVNVTIGTDSTHSGCFNLFEEIHYDRALYRQLYGEDLPAATIFKMITENAAKAFWLQKDLGTLESGKLADVLVLKAKHDDPFENLASADMKDVELLTIAGKPMLGEMRFIEFLGGTVPEDYSQINIDGRSMFVVGDPAKFYIEARKKIGFKKTLDFLPFEPEE
ncbi:MAG: amidohydrolase family protein [Treponema sp.]|jgi:cytosine/adenosine deaminase-related metal-dependent hydrolase|nr:amidohydrolase family protein [Treponema sp.]